VIYVIDNIKYLFVIEKISINMLLSNKRDPRKRKNN